MIEAAEVATERGAGHGLPPAACNEPVILILVVGIRPCQARSAVTKSSLGGKVALPDRALVSRMRQQVGHADGSSGDDDSLTNNIPARRCRTGQQRNF